MFKQPSARFYLASEDGARAIFSHWIDIEDPTSCGATSVPIHDVRASLLAIDGALPHGDSGADVREALSNDLWTQPAASAEILRPLTVALLPPPLLAKLDAVNPETGRVRIVVNPGALWSRIPWALLPVGNRRLIDVADVVFTVAAPVLDDRARLAEPHDQNPPLYVLDPLPDEALLPTRKDKERWATYAAEQGAAVLGLGHDVSRRDLSRGLRSQPSRLLYLGHCVQPPDNSSPVMTGMLLFDVRSATPAARGSLLARAGSGEPLYPLTALDLIAGAAEGGVEDARATSGPELWPMPSKVALIACGSGMENAYHESLGLVTACVNGGAEYVVATRWSLPADRMCEGATSKLAREIDRALSRANVVGACGDLLRTAGAEWVADPVSVATSPMLWASLELFHAPTRTTMRQGQSAARESTAERESSVGGADNLSPESGEEH